MSNIREILQINTVGLKNEKTPECVGYEWNDAIIPSVPQNHITYRPLAVQLNKLFPEAKNILELGCGAGNLAAHYRELNPKVTYVTIDINSDVVNNGIIDTKYHHTIYTDRPYQLMLGDEKMKFDLILSYEHFEHIPPDNMLMFLTNIKNHCSENTLVIATAGIFYRDVHPSLMNRNQWEQLLNSMGFELLPYQILVPELVPFNFELHNTVELIFKLKSN